MAAGLMYKDDPTILAWDLMYALPQPCLMRCPSGSSAWALAAPCAPHQTITASQPRHKGRKAVQPEPLPSCLGSEVSVMPVTGMSRAATASPPTLPLGILSCCPTAASPSAPTTSLCGL